MSGRARGVSRPRQVDAGLVHELLHRPVTSVTEILSALRTSLDPIVEAFLKKSIAERVPSARAGITLLVDAGDAGGAGSPRDRPQADERVQLKAMPR